MPSASGSFTQVVRTGLEEACRAFTAAVEPDGFVRTKKMFWCRQREHTVEFVHFHRSGSTYGAPSSGSVRIRVHFGIRVLNDSFEASALNGPTSEDPSVRLCRFHLRFNAETGSTFDRCVQDLVRCLREQGEPWFQRFAEPKALLEDAASPLSTQAKALLSAAINGQATSEHIALSRKLLGIKKAET